MLIDYRRGQTSIVLRIKLLNSSVATGAGLTGLTSASTGLIISTIANNEATPTAYTVAGSTIETITTLGTFAAPTATKCRFKEVDATNHKGIYEIQIADARFAVASAKSLLVSLSGATNLAECDALIPLKDLDPYDSVRAGLTALPNAAAEAAAGLYTRGTGAGQINQPANGRIDTNPVALAGTTLTGRDIGASVLLSSGTGTGQLDFTSGVIKANLAQILGSALTETAGLLAAGFKKFFNVATPTGTVNSLPDAVAGAASGLALVGSNLGSASSVTGAVGSVTGNVGGNVVGSVASVTAGVTLAASAVQAIWDAATSALTTAGSIGKWILDKLDVVLSTRAQTGDAMALTSGERTTVATAVWASATRTLSSFGTLVADVWASATRVLTAGTNIVLAKGVGVTGFNDLSAAQVNSEADTALADVGLTPTVTGRIDAAVTTRLASGTVASDVTAVKAKTDLLPDGIQKNTALANFEFLMVEATDHVTPKTGLTVTAQRSIDGAAFASCANVVSEVGSGIYKITLAAADLNGDVVTLKFSATGADTRFVTLTTNI